jgi:hypothetical protein
MASALAVEPIGSLRIVGLDLRRDHALAQPSKHAAFQSLAVYGAGVVCRPLPSIWLVQASQSGLGALCAPNPSLSAWRAQTGAASGRQGRSREAGGATAPACVSDMSDSLGVKVPCVT